MVFLAKGQGESLIKILVVAIIAIIALALAKSYFQRTSKKTQETVEDIFSQETRVSLALDDLQFGWSRPSPVACSFAATESGNPVR